MTDRLLTRPQVADRFQITPRHLADLEKEHSIPILKAGRAVRYDTAAILQLEAALRCPSRSHAAAPQALGRSSAPLPGSASGNLRSGFSTLCGGWCRRTANFPTGFRASAVGSPCTDMRAVARHYLCCGGRTLKMRRLGARWSALRSLNTQRPLRETKGVKVVR